MPSISSTSDDSHQQLLDKLNITPVPRPFRNPNWKPPQRRNKNIKQILTEASRKEASLVATQNNSGTSTPAPPGSSGATGGLSTPNVTANGLSPQANIAQAAQNLSTLVLERNTHNALASGPIATYTNIESAPSLHPAHQKRYCDITGLPAPYTDPKTRLRYHNKEVFGVVRTLGQGVPDKYLEARGAHIVLK
ncbi:MAG: chromatin-remodeling complex subunit ies6 [Piccolia ochrophora]|nr:MAG: chromatin-remodeling complex subunit ies6 [Piccolia ochrophora]